jgi:hypothetical protein
MSIKIEQALELKRKAGRSESPSSGKTPLPLDDSVNEESQCQVLKCELMCLMEEEKIYSKIDNPKEGL